jgi:hypothetical protein
VLCAVRYRQWLSAFEPEPFAGSIHEHGGLMPSAFDNAPNCQKVKIPLPLNTLADSIEVIY